jgi:hypothetical protein
MGVIGTAVTALRLWKVVVLYQLYGNDTNSPRWFIEMTNVVLLSQIECSIIVVCANLPGLAAWLKRSVGSRAASGGRGDSGGTGSRTLSCSPSCGLSSCGLSKCGKGSGTTSQTGGDAGAGAGGARATTGGGDSGGSCRRRGLLRHLRWWGARRQGAGRGGAGGGAGAAAARNSRGSYSYRLKALRAPERSFNRSAQDAATACDSESVENFVVVAQDEAEARRAAREGTARQRTQWDQHGPWQQQQQLRRKPVQSTLPPPEGQQAQRHREQPGPIVLTVPKTPASPTRDKNDSDAKDSLSVGDDDMEQAGPVSIHVA